jgi:hypothetical protein
VEVTAGALTPGTVTTATLSLTGTSTFDARDSVETEIVARYRSSIYLPVILRSYPPIPLITSAAVETVRGGSGYTYVPQVQVTVSATVHSDVVQDIRFRTAGEDWGGWLPFISGVPYAYTFTTSSGYKGLYVEVRGAEGGVSEPELVSVSLLSNGDFEEGLAGWSLSHQALPLPSLSGDGRALLGSDSLGCNPVPIGSSSLYQTLDLTDVPVGQSIILYVDYDIYTEDKLGSGDYDRFVVLVDGKEIYRDGYQGSDSYGCGKWHQVTRQTHALNLTAYRGQVVRVLFGNYTRFDDWYNTYTFLDNIHLVVR